MRACTVAGAVLLACAVGFAHGAASSRAEFSPVDRVLITEYRVLERERVPVILAVVPERAARIAAILQRQGVSIIGRRDSIGYLYAWVPIDAAESLQGLDGVQAMQVAASPVRASLDSSNEQTNSRAREPAKVAVLQSGVERGTAGGQARIPRGVGPSSSTPADNPFTGEAATQAAAFKALQPTFDGRGVTTAFVEPVAPNLSTMRGALDLSGRPVPKITHYELARSIEPAAPVAGVEVLWQRTEAVKPDEHGGFTWLDRSYRLPAAWRPAATRWRICRRLPGGLLTPIREAVDILWAVDAGKVWVLVASGSADFSQAASTSLDESVPWIAIGDEVSRRADAMAPHAFVFAADPQRQLLASAVTHALHAGMVGSVMAGAKFLGSEANGVAPAAQVRIYHAGQTYNAPSLAGTEIMLAMLADPAVDVAEASYAVGDTGRFGAVPPHHFWAERLLRESGKPFVKAIGNYGAWLFGADEFTTAPDVFAVGAYTPRETWLANLGVDTRTEHTLASYSGWGPADDGGLKPDFLALTHTLTESTLRNWYWANTPGFGVSGGTSASAPNGAGHVALLVSAAKQSRIPHDAARLRAAIATTSKFIEGVEARAQGHGLIQISDAWVALQRASRWTPARFRIEAPLVGAETREGGPERLTGRGLFEMSGWRPGETGRRELTVTRIGGGASRYRLRWKGHSRVFTSEREQIELPLGKAVKIPVDIRVGAVSGSYSAILDLIDPSVDLMAGSVLLTVLVADPLPADGAVPEYRRDAPRLGNTLFFVDVPAGLAALTVRLSKDDTPSVWLAQDPTERLMPFNPYGSEVYRSKSSSEWKARERVFTYTDPVPGVWMFTLQNREPGSMDELNAISDWSKPMPLEVKIQAIPTDALSLSEGPAGGASFRRRPNLDAEIRAVGLAAARVRDVTLSPGLKPAFFDVTVDPGATRFEVQIDGARRDTRIGLYIYKIPEGERYRKSISGTSDDTALVYFDASFQPARSFALDAPPPGRYRVALDPIRVPPGGVTLSYQDAVYHPLYGSLNMTPGADVHSAHAGVSVRAQPEAGRRLLAKVGLFSPRGERRDLVLSKGWFVTQVPPGAYAAGP